MPISEDLIVKTAKFLVKKDRVKTEILMKLLELEDGGVESGEIIVAIFEDRKISTSSSNILKQLERLEDMGLVKSYTPIGRKRPKIWELTEIGRKIAEAIRDLRGMIE